MTNTTKSAASDKQDKKPAAKRAPSAAFMKALKPSEALAAVVGTDALPRTEVTKKIWAYIKAHDLQNPQNKRMIRADDKLRAVFGQDEVSMFEMTKLVNQHLSAV